MRQNPFLIGVIKHEIGVIGDIKSVQSVILIGLISDKKKGNHYFGY
jgi:hypothetical protein